MTSDTSALIAETLAAHTDRAFGRGGPTCSCEAWSPSPRAKTFRDLAMEFRLHRADAILAALDGRLLPDGGASEERIGHWSAHNAYAWECGGHDAGCELPVSHHYTRTEWPDGSVHTGPWRAAETEDQP